MKKKPRDVIITKPKKTKLAVHRLVKLRAPVTVKIPVAALEPALTRSLGGYLGQGPAEIAADATFVVVSDTGKPLVELPVPKTLFQKLVSYVFP